MMVNRIKRNILIASLGIFAQTIMAQNITDQAVSGARQADAVVQQRDIPVPDSVFMHPDRIRYDSRCWQIEGRDVYLYSGTFHYFRTPEALWKDRLQKMKAAGFNGVETYVPWNWHERTEPASVDDYSKADMGELERFLQLAEGMGFYIILRPGPYICAEWSGGGFPQWLMNKRPAKPLHDVWLQSIDKDFVAWNRHWYTAVARVVQKHQLTHRQPGTGGVILWQIENEFNRIKWFLRSEKRQYLESLAVLSRQLGIEVPIITCWTDESRNVSKGPLTGIVDMVNSYPRWNIDKSFGRLINMQLKSQPGKPLLSGELQGGWLSEVGGKMPWEQEGLWPVQTQNITLYALQRGFSGINYYMVVGGTNFDDWAARQQTVSYDYSAAIGEDGTMNDRYRRYQGLSAFLREHGTRIARADLKTIAYRSTDAAVTLALREAKNGDRYYFVRTEDHERPHFGEMQTADFAFSYSLEAFGSMVYYLPAGARQGEWFPRLPDPLPVSITKRDSIALSTVLTYDRLPKRWTKLKKGETVDQQGINGRHLIYYTAKAEAGKALTVGRVGQNQMNRSDADEVLVSVGGKQLEATGQDATSISYLLPGDSLSGKKVDVVLLYVSKGLHHHTNQAVEANWHTGPSFVRCGGRDLALSYAYTEAQTGLSISEGKSIKMQAQGLLAWNVNTFSLPTGVETSKVRCHLRLEHTGNGFIYVNGHCIGWCWERGPQRDYYIPECWLRATGNVVAISLASSGKPVSIQKASIALEYEQ